MEPDVGCCLLIRNHRRRCFLLISMDVVRVREVGRACNDSLLIALYVYYVVTLLLLRQIYV